MRTNKPRQKLHATTFGPDADIDRLFLPGTVTARFLWATPPAPSVRIGGKDGADIGVIGDGSIMAGNVAICGSSLSTNRLERDMGDAPLGLCTRSGGADSELELSSLRSCLPFW